jgi:hypothetical protein
MLLPPDQFASAMGRLGVGDGDRIVVYDTSGTNFSAARAWWMFRIYGHDDVAVLDGGSRGVEARWARLESGEVVRPPATFTPRYRRELVRTLDEVRHCPGRRNRAGGGCALRRPLRRDRAGATLGSSGRAHAGKPERALRLVHRPRRTVARSGRLEAPLA